MKKIASLLCVFMLFVSCPAFADNEINLEDYTFEQLITLRQQIDNRITQIATTVDYSAYTLDGLGYVSNGSEVRINFYEGTNPELIIPAEIDGLPVTQIHQAAFEKNKTITSVVIPNTITVIPDECFSGCSKLTSVVLPDTITTIGWWAFHGTRVKSINFPEGLTTIDTAIFQSASGPEGVVILPTTLTSDMEYTFSGVDYLNGAIIQSSIKIGYAAFNGDRFEFIYIKDGCNVTIDSKPFGSGLRTAIIPASVTSISDNAFADSNRVTIVCPPGSYAESYAKSHFIMCDTEHYEQYVQEYDAQYLN